MWSFGVTLWELYSDAATPYGGLSNFEVTEFVAEGKRLKKPKNCPKDVFQVIADCWNESPKERPTFEQIFTRLEIIVQGVNPQTNDLGLTTSQKLGSKAEDPPAFYQNMQDQ